MLLCIGMCVSTDESERAKQSFKKTTFRKLSQKNLRPRITSPLFIVMNPIIKFYAALLAYIKSDVEVNGAVEEILKLAKEASPSWEVTKENVEELEEICNRGNQLDEDNHKRYVELMDFTEEVSIAAFKDLAVLKWPLAMDLFEKLHDCLALPGDSFVWARSIKRRPDGSALVILHVSDYERFKGMIEDHHHVTCKRELEKCVLVGT
jgi:hypothetical protein